VGTILSLQYISATRYALMQPAIPVLGTVISVTVGLEHLNILKAAGIAFAGVNTALF